ncbi:MAG: energy transducer TonB [Candidatus Sulfotelmatobacter sp.]
MKNRIALAAFAFASLLMLFSNYVCAQQPSVGRKLVAQVVPQYLGLARTMNIQGTVRLDMLVASNGKVTSVEVTGGHPVLAQSAQNAPRQWKWEPAPHETHEIVEMKFKP